MDLTPYCERHTYDVNFGTRLSVGLIVGVRLIGRLFNSGFSVHCK